MGTTALNIAISVAQIASPVLYGVFIVVIYFQLRSARDSVREVREEFLAGGRPVVAVHDEYDASSQTISLVVENVGRGPAKNVTFDFSRPLESSDGVVISQLPLFTIGLTSLSPAAKITCHWDEFDDLITLLHEQDLEGDDFVVTVRYGDLTGARYSNDWDIQPAIYQGLRSHQPSRTPDARERRPAEKSNGDGPDTEPSPTTTTGPAAPLSEPSWAGPDSSPGVNSS